MSFSRRSFMKTLGVGAAGAITSEMLISRRPETLLDLLSQPLHAQSSDILIHNNENPVGPGQLVMDAIRTSLGPTGSEGGRYPFSLYGDMIEALVSHYNAAGVKRENVLLGNGSTQLLRTLTHISCSKTNALVGSEPTYEECAGYAALIGAPVYGTKLTDDLKLNLDTTLTAAKGAGMVFFCNPNNPTATAHNGADSMQFITDLIKASPTTNILVDEAYFDYATDPNFKTMIPLALEHPQVVVCRTFSKAYGMAGLRLGYAVGHATTIKKMAQWDGMGYINMAAVVGGIAHLTRTDGFIEKEQARNTAAREYTRTYFHDKGYSDTDSQTNFLFVDVKAPIARFQAECRELGVRVGRPFPPLMTRARISIGTMDEMQRATKVFDTVLAQLNAAAA
jgi:histidinol-phosphate aminotransferase